MLIKQFWFGQWRIKIGIFELILTFIITRIGSITLRIISTFLFQSFEDWNRNSSWEWNRLHGRVWYLIEKDTWLIFSFFLLKPFTFRTIQKQQPSWWFCCLCQAIGTPKLNDLWVPFVHWRKGSFVYSICRWNEEPIGYTDHLV